jgi:hypothetical protein
MAKPSSFGVCQACGARKGKAAMFAHVQDCMPRQVGAGSSRAPEPLLLLRAEARGRPMFWLDVAVKREGKLKDVDRFLRHIWLECCGHMSEFSTGTHRKVSMNAKVSDALGAGDRLDYVYDFGSSTELLVRLLGGVNASSKGAVRLAARNEPPMWPCDACGKAATAVCAQCLYEGKGFCCAAHAPDHDCGENMLLPVVNSPRMGVCGYTGEA